MTRRKYKKWKPIMKKAYEFVNNMAPVKVRQVFYFLITQGLIENNYADYVFLIIKLRDARKAGEIAWWQIVDGSRSPLVVNVWNDITSYLDTCKTSYRKNLWKDRDIVPAIFLEKDALAKILWGVSQQFQVPIFVTRGQASWSLMANDVSNFIEKYWESDIACLVFTDWDWAGKLIEECYQRMLEELGHYTIFRKVALTEDQVKEFNLPTIPAKRPKKTFLKFYRNWVSRYGNLSCELDALPPNVLRDLVSRAIKEFITEEELEKHQKKEKKETKRIEQIITRGLKSLEER